MNQLNGCAEQMQVQEWTMAGLGQLPDKTGRLLLRARAPKRTVTAAHRKRGRYNFASRLMMLTLIQVDNCCAKTKPL